MTDSVSSLETQLREKEQLVAALTERLEQAAEQLDRIRRTGGDRGLRGGGGIPPELIEEQQALAAELQQAVRQWEETQPGATLGRIEVQLTELRDLVSGLAGGEGFPAEQSVAAPSLRGRTDVRDGDNSKASGPALSGYEAMKAELLETEPAPTTAAAKLPVATAAYIKPEEIAPVDPPAVIDLDAAGVEELRTAVEHRDSYISYLTRALRAAEMMYKQSLDWEALNNAPDDLRRRLEDLEKTLHATLRHAEVDHSLERARLGREAARLEQLQEHLRREMHRLNLTDPHDDDDEAHDNRATPEVERSANSRWQRLFGKK
ncbi:MAG: hypothetical protein WD648_04225 [Planctomycetaceae bacterium]